MDELQCEICCKIFNDSSRRPKNLHCGHTFCSECMAKEITNGKSTCPTCRKPHNSKSVAELPMNVTLERLIRKVIETLRAGAKSSDSEDEDEEDDFSGGPCSTHKIGVLYFYCETHSVQICRECTVIDHPASTCKLTSFKEEIEKQKADNISKTSSTVTAVNDTLSGLGEFIEENDQIMSSKENKIQECKNTIAEATKAIAEETKAIDTVKIASEKARNQIDKGRVKIKNMEAAKLNLQNAKKKKAITNTTEDIETVTKDITKWIQDVTKELEISSSAPANILQGLRSSKIICAETSVNGQKVTAKLEAKDDKLHMHPFKCESPQEGATIVQYEKIVGNLPRQPPTLLFLDLTHSKTYKGRVYIRLEPELHAFIKHIPAIFTGEYGNSVLGKTCVTTHASYHLAIWIQKAVNDIPLRKQESVTVKSGAVICSFGGKPDIRAMFLYLECERTYDSNFAKIGHVVSGLDVAKACKALGHHSSISISDCGLVLEM